MDTTPTWTRARVEFKVENRLPVPVRNLSVSIVFLRSSTKAGQDPTPIPGWQFLAQLTEREVPQAGATFFTVVRKIPQKKNVIPADELSYRVTLQDYRLSVPSLETALTLLSSPHASDQHAALLSFEATPAHRSALTSVLPEKLDAALEAPTMDHALTLCLIFHTAGAIRWGSGIPRLLELVPVLEAPPWPAVFSRLRTVFLKSSPPNAPRLALVAAQNWVHSIEHAVLNMQDTAVPGLILATHHDSTPTRARAKRLLQVLDRGNPKAQLSIPDPTISLSVIELFGRLKIASSVPALIKKRISAPDPQTQDATERALLAIGDAAIVPLLEALGGKEHEVLLPIVARLGSTHMDRIRKEAEDLGVTPVLGEPLEGLLRRFREERAKHQSTNRLLQAAVERHKNGSPRTAYRALDTLERQDPQILTAARETSSEVLAAWGQTLYLRGDYDRALPILKRAWALSPQETTHSMIQKAHLALVQGFIELGDFSEAENRLERMEPTSVPPKLRAALLVRRATQAMDRSQGPLAATLIEHAAALHPRDPELQTTLRNLRWRLHVRENLPTVFALALLLVGATLSGWLVARARWKRRRLEALAQGIDGGRTRED